MSANINSTQVSTSLMPLFPTKESLEAVIELGMAQLPITTPNALMTILMCYHNTLVTQINKENNNG